MNVEIALPLGFIALVVILLIYSRIIGPRRRIQRFKKEMATQGWQEYRPHQVPEWPAFEKVAVEGIRGRERHLEYEEKRGFRREQVKKDEKRTATVQALVCSFPGTNTRLAACATTTTAEKESRRGLILIGKSFHWHTSRELWWGESRPLPVQENTLLYSWFSRMGGDFFKKMAADRGVPLDRVIPELGSPGENEGFEILRPVFERHQTMLDAVRQFLFLLDLSRSFPYLLSILLSYLPFKPISVGREPGGLALGVVQ